MGAPSNNADAKHMRTALAILFIFAASMPAQAMGMCGKRDDFVRSLAAQYNEQPIALGIAGEVNLVEIYNSGPGGSWTMLVTVPEGSSCIIAAGKDFELLPPPKPIEKGKDS